MYDTFGEVGQDYLEHQLEILQKVDGIRPIGSEHTAVNDSLTPAVLGSFLLGGDDIIVPLLDGDHQENAQKVAYVLGILDEAVKRRKEAGDPPIDYFLQVSGNMLRVQHGQVS